MPALHRARLVSANPLAGDGRVVEGGDAIGEDLVSVAALARDQDDIAGPGIGQGGLDGELAVGFDAAPFPGGGNRRAGRRGSGRDPRCGGCSG